MSHHDELHVCVQDAEALAEVLRTHRRTRRLGRDASDALAELLFKARLVPPEALPAGCVGLGTMVTYVEVPVGTPRWLTLVLPKEADAVRGRVSVLSPLGLALIGRRRGEYTEAHMARGSKVRIRIVGALNEPAVQRRAA